MYRSGAKKHRLICCHRIQTNTQSKEMLMWLINWKARQQRAAFLSLCHLTPTRTWEIRVNQLRQRGRLNDRTQALDNARSQACMQTHTTPIPYGHNIYPDMHTSRIHIHTHRHVTHTHTHTHKQTYKHLLAPHTHTHNHTNPQKCTANIHLHSLCFSLSLSLSLSLLPYRSLLMTGVPCSSAEGCVLALLTPLQERRTGDRV